MENSKGVKLRVLLLFYNDAIAFEETVCLVGRQMKTVLVAVDGNRGLFGNLSPVMEIDVVRESEFSKMHESEEAHK